MSLDWAKAWRCDLCGHKWLAVTSEPPQQCPKCRKRHWHDGRDHTISQPPSGRETASATLHGFSARVAGPQKASSDTPAPAIQIRCVHCGLCGDCACPPAQGCLICGGTKFWRATYGPIACSRCAPPSTPAVVAALLMSSEGGKATGSPAETDLTTVVQTAVNSGHEGEWTI
jgi:hypothetical protein